MALAPGTKLGPYEIKALLGQGGMGEVYRARDTRLERDVAIKVLPASFAREPERLHRFEQEARSVAALNDPHLLIVFDVGTMPLEHDGRTETIPYLVSELLEGTTLRERLTSGPLAERKALDYAVQIARGLAAAQDRGIVHRDIKPENIYITHEGRVKILDFGLAKLAESEEGAAARAEGSNETVLDVRMVHTRVDVVMGTAGYMSPEQLRGKPIDARSDIFSFGAVLYEMLAGRRAFTGDSPADVMSAILNREPPELTTDFVTVSPGLERIVRRCLEKSPQQRFQSAGDLAFGLQELSGPRSLTSGSGMMARAETGEQARAETVAPAKKRWWEIPVAVVALLAAAGGGAWWARRGGEATPPKFTQVTFQQGLVKSSRFLHDGLTILSAARFGSEPGMGLHVGTTETVGVRSLNIPADDVASVSVNDDILLIADEKAVGPGYVSAGTLKELHYGGGAPRPVMDNVQFADWDPEGKKFAVVRYVPETHKYRLEYPAGTVLYETSGWVGNPRFARDGKTIAFLDHPIFGDDQGSVATVDMQGKVRKWKNVYGSAQGLAWSPDGKEIWLSAGFGLSRSLWAAAMNGSERSLLTAPGSLDLQDALASGKVLVTSLAERRVQMVVTPEFPEPRDFTWMDFAYEQRFSADGKQLLFGDQHDGNLYGTFLEGVDGTPAVRLGDGNPMDLSPDGKYALSSLSMDLSQIELLPTGTGESRQLTHEKVDFLSARWLDNTRILASGNEAGHPVRVYAIDLEGHVKAVTPEGMLGVAVSGPGAGDGKKLLVQKRENGKRELMILPLVDGGGVNIGVGPGEAGPELGEQETALEFTADGKGIYVEKVIAANKGELWQVDFGTGKRTLLHSVTAPGIPAVSQGMQSIISRDGKSYAYQYHPSLSTEYVVEGLR
jgi:WD40 repeat protein